MQKQANHSARSPVDDAPQGWQGRHFQSGERLISQALIDDFAALTGDEQFIHTDPVAAARTPFGGTVAHGFLLLSMLSSLAYEAIPPLPGQHMSVNAGFDRIRFVRPCQAGLRVRARFELAGAQAVQPGQMALVWDVALSADDADDRPLLVARWLTRMFTAHPEERKSDA